MGGDGWVVTGDSTGMVKVWMIGEKVEQWVEIHVSEEEIGRLGWVNEHVIAVLTATQIQLWDIEKKERLKVIKRIGESRFVDFKLIF